MVPSKWIVTGRLAVFLALVAALVSPCGGSPSPSLDDLDLDDLNLDDPQLDQGLGELGSAGQSWPHQEKAEDQREEEEEEHVGEVVLSGHAEPTVAQKETDVYRLVSSAMRQASVRRQLSQVLPIVRAMTPAQRLALAAMLSQAAAGRADPGLPLARSPAQQLLLPLSWDIAHLITQADADSSGRPHRSHQTVAAPQAQQLRRRMGGGPASFRRSPPPPPPPSLTRPAPPPLDLSPPPGNNRRNAVVTTDIQPPPPPKKLRTPPPPPPAPHDVPPTPATGEQHQQLTPTTFRPSPARPQHRLEPSEADAEPQACNLVANDLCLEDDDYPDSAILASIRRSQGSMDAMLLDSGQRATSPATTTDRRPGSPTAAALTSQQTSESGPASLCASRTQLARPRRARATSGQWKFVVNVGEYTQTLRLDVCLKPRESCGLLPDTVESRCQQVYNYHRLLTWDNERGLHMDIFKVPTCCTCQVTAVHPLLQRTTRPHGDAAKHRDADNTAKHRDADADSDADADAAVAVASRLPPATTSTTAATTPTPSFLPTRHSFRRPATPSATGSPGFLPPRGPPLPLADHGGADVDSRLSWLKRNRSSLYNRYPPRRPQPHVISSDSIRRGSSTRPPQPQPPRTPPTLPTPSDADSPSPDGLSGGSLGPHRRVNYSYHPIIDYIRQQQLAERPAAVLQSRSGEGWTPIEAAAGA